jgi:poly-gamma-glutamate synthesis protein (capsule biosynthesis protein)
VLKNAGLDIVSFANNHVGDWGRTAFDDTRRRLDGAGILYTGSGDNKADAEQPTIIEKDGIKIGFLGFTDVGPEWLAATENQSGVLLANDPDIANIIKNASMQVDVLITSFHWGIEYSEHNARQTALAHTAIDNGAKLVIGHHPHVIEATENYKDGLIAYSLGNFIFDQYFSAETMKGMILKVTLDTQTKSIKNSEKYIVKLNSAFQPETPVPFK